MAFSPNVRSAFDAWIQVPTWHSGHPLDEKRFYRFVWSVLEFSRRRPTGQDLRSEIIEACSGEVEQSFLEQKARQYSSLYESLYEFAKSKSRFR